VNDIRQITQLPPEKVFENTTFRTLIEGLDTLTLRRTLPEARRSFATGLPAFLIQIERDYGISHTPMSVYTLTDWLIRFLEAPETLAVVLSMHQRVPGSLIREGLPYLLSLLDTMPNGRTEWQQALAVMSLPLVAKL
jgi:hypothetical protein